MIGEQGELERKRYLEGIALFNDQQFFQAHEVWEDAWRAATGLKREFFQGLVQCAVALEHYRRSNPRGMASLYRSYRRHLRDMPDVFMDLDVKSFLAAMREAIGHVVEADPLPEKGTITLDASRVPRIELRAPGLMPAPETSPLLACHYPAIPPPRDVSLTTLMPHACGYLPDRVAQLRGFLGDRMPSEVYHEFMDAGFRRSGRLVYQPICAGCRACVPIRIPVARFGMTKSQRRCNRRNADLRLTIGRPRVTDEKYAIYVRYMQSRHEPGGDVFRETFASFLYDSPVRTREFCYHDSAGRLLAVGLCDLCEHSLSSVYFYFDPTESSRGLGTFGVLREIDFARKNSIPFYYLGYHVAGCASMQYKSNFGPHELLGADGVWRSALS